MKLKLLFIAFVFFTILSLKAQVGVGNTDPQSTLDITASSTTSPANNDGILIPRMSNFPSTPGATRDGMLIFYTGTGASGKGFYYWDNATTSWTAITPGSVDDGDWTVIGGNVVRNTGNVLINSPSRNFKLSVSGTSASSQVSTIDIGPSATSDNAVNIIRSYNTYGFGLSARQNSTDIFNNKGAISAYNALGSFTTNLAYSTFPSAASYGVYSRTSDPSVNAHGGFFEITSNNAVAYGGIQYGLRSVSHADGNSGEIYGVKSEVSGSGDSDKFGFHTTIPASSNGLQYGIYSDVQNTSGFAGYFLGRTSLGIGTTNRYLMPEVDGTSGQVMTTDGSGNITFQNVIGDGIGTDNQNLVTPTLTGTTLDLGIENGSGTSIDLASLQDGNTQNTLDQAYDQGGAGAGRTITADAGAILINGNDGFQVTGGTYGSGATLALSGAGTKMFFYPRKAAFRAGLVVSTDWDDTNIGAYSTAFGNNTEASGTYSIAMGSNTEASESASTAMGSYTIASGFNTTAMGYFTTASGQYSTAMGNRTNASGNSSNAMGNYTGASSFAETAIGTYNINTTPNSPYIFDISDQIFSIGNGIDNSNRSNALTIYKNGLMNINDEYDMPLTDGSPNQVMTTDGAGVVSFVNASTLVTSNTLDQAYDQGGAGAGRTITANDGAVLINGADGFQNTGTFGSGANLILAGAGTKMFFYPRKSAFRAGNVTGTSWNDSNIGDYSTAFGRSTTASGDSSTAMGSNARATGSTSTAFGAGTEASGERATAFGYITEASGEVSTAMGHSTTASGDISTAMGQSTTASGYASTALGYFTTALGGYSTSMGFSTLARSYAETTVGLFNTTYTPTSATSTNTFYPNDRLFVIGNGTSSSSRSNALTIYKSGLMNINDSYNMPLNDGAANQVMTTDGAGNVSFSTLTSESTTANNGLTETGDNIQLGGELIQTTYITQNNNDMVFNLNGTGDFRIIEDGSTTKLVVLDNGDTVLGGDLYMRDENTGGTVLGRLVDINGDDGALDLYDSGALSTRINGGGDSYLTGGNLGIGTTTPDYNLSVSGTLNLREDLGTGTALRVNGTEALWFDGTYFSWGYGGTKNYFADPVGIGFNDPSYQLDVRDANASDYVAQMYNTSADANADGLKIRVGNTSAPTSSTTFIGFFDGNGGLGTNRGRIQGNGTGVTYNTTSDRRLKTNITNIDNALNLIDKILPRRYEYKTNLGTQEYGFIAQELQPLYPQAVTGTPDSDAEKNPMMVDYSRLTPLLTAGIKELSDKVKTLETENASLKARLDQLEVLEARLTALENTTNSEEKIVVSNEN